MRKIFNFNSFINEATIKGNTGFPGEDPNKPLLNDLPNK
jgi:hypothetical protein